jgi:hypothetical protein
MVQAAGLPDSQRPTGLQLSTATDWSGARNTAITPVAQEPRDVSPLSRSPSSTLENDDDGPIYNEDEDGSTDAVVLSLSPVDVASLTSPPSSLGGRMSLTMADPPPDLHEHVKKMFSEYSRTLKETLREESEFAQSRSHCPVKFASNTRTSHGRTEEIC